MDMNKFELLRASGKLPSPKGVALAIIRLTQQDEVSIAELARVIGGDPAFVGRVIKAANGLIAFNRRRIASVPEALMVLGLPAVRSMVLGFSLISDYRAGRCAKFDYDRFWSYSIALALGMQMLAQRTRIAPPDELFSLGLLVRVGELALATLYPEQYSQVLAQAAQQPERGLTELEREALAMTHGDLAVAMLSEWGVPAVFVEVARHYDDPGSATFAEGERPYALFQSLLTACCFAQVCVADGAAPTVLVNELVERGERLGVAREDLLADCNRMHVLFSDWCALLGLGFKPTAAIFEPRQSAHESPLPERTDARMGPADGCEYEVAAGVGAIVDAAESDVARVLVIERDAALRESVAAELRRMRGEVYEAGDARVGLDLAVGLQPGMIVVGAGLPDMDGLRLVCSLRAIGIGQPVYFLVIAPGADGAAQTAFFEAGADDVVTSLGDIASLTVSLRAGLRVARLQLALEHERAALGRFAAELAVTNRRLQEAAMTDALTGLPNRRYAIDRAQQEWAVAGRTGKPLACMVIDLDGLKYINDEFGHDAGDWALRSTGGALRQALRSEDVICRTGGDEFLALCPGSDLSAALVCAERLRLAVSRMDLKFEGQHVPLSVSVGVAEKDEGIANVDALRRTADRGAYLAKAAGRNAVAAEQRDPAVMRKSEDGR
ncbi:MAG: diguanylate cyclase [Rhodocyclales bacterium]|nr:diguanylate cyclase [Rhodocyclales bacterium]